MSQSTEQTSFRIASLVGYLISAAAVVAIPLIAISPEARSPHFWHKIIWIEFLVLILWAYIGGAFRFFLPSAHHRRCLAGVLPAAGTLVFVYTITSFLLMVLCDWTSRFHWAAQVILILGLVLPLVFFEFARVGAAAGTEPMPSSIRAPHELAAQLRFHEDRLWTSTPGAEARKLSEAIKALRERIQYSLPNDSRLGQDSGYQALSTRICEFCTELTDLGEENPDAEKISRLRGTAVQLAGQAESVVSSSKVRPS